MEATLFPQDTPKIIPIWLRDTYARVQPGGLFNLDGHSKLNNEIEMEAKRNISSGFSNDNFFLSGSNIFGYLNRTLNSSICNQVVTVAVQGLRDLYWNNRGVLPRSEEGELQFAMNRTSPTFTNIFDYPGLRSFSDWNIVPIYQLYGTLTTYDVVQIPVKYFLESINQKLPISVQLEGVNIIIQFSYREYDFWDPEADKVIDNIDMSRCQSL